MKKRYIASPHAVAYCLLIILIVTFPSWILCAFKIAEQSIAILLIPTGMSCVFFGIFYAFFHNAFCVCTLDEEGIKNRHLTLRWEDVDKIELISGADLFKYRFGFWKIECPSLICFGTIQDQSSFWSLSSRYTLFLAISQKRLKMMRTLGGGKSEQLDRFLEYYIE